MKKLTMVLAGIALSYTSAFAFSNADLHGRYVMHEEGSYRATNGVTVSNRAVGIINADGKNTFRGWEYSYAEPSNPNFCKFGITGHYNIAEDGHLVAYITYQRFQDSPVTCGNGPIGGTWDAGVSQDRNHVSFGEHDDYGIASGELSR